MGQVYRCFLLWIVFFLQLYSCSPENGDKDQNSNSKSTSSSDSNGNENDDSKNTTSSLDDDVPNIAIIVPEVFSAGERIGYLLEFDHSAVLKIWDDEHHRIFRINENTGFLLGVPDHEYFEDSECTVPQLWLSPAPSECGRGSPEAAPTVFAKNGSRHGTFMGEKVQAYSPLMQFLPYYVIREDLDPPCYRDFNENKAFKGCMRTIEDHDGVPLAFSLPIEIRSPNPESPTESDSSENPDSLLQSTLRVYSHDDYIGDFVDFRDEAIYIYNPLSQRLMGVNHVTGILIGGVGIHIFLDDQCAVNLARASIWERLLCSSMPDGVVPPRPEIWGHRGDPEGWKIGEYALQSTGNKRVISDVYFSLWDVERCLRTSSTCVQDAEILPDFPLSFPTPIEIRKEPWR